MQTRRRGLRQTSLIAAGLAALALTTAQAQDLPDPMDFGKMYEEFAFEAADTDGNNLVSEGEFARDAAAAFSGLDVNRDSKLSPGELGPHNANSFARVDADNDGYLTFNEVMTYKMKAFNAADTNQDDALSFDEMTSAVEKEIGQ